MKGAQNVGRLIGALLILQFIGLAAGFIILAPGVTTDYLTQASGMPGAIRTAVLVLLANAAVALGISLAAGPVLREYGGRTAVLLVAVSIIWVVLQSVDNAHILSMLSLSTRFSEAAGANTDLYDLLGALTRSTRGWVHFTVLLVTDVWLGVFYAALFAFRLVPRLLAGLGLLAVALHLIGIPFAAFLGYPFVWEFAYGLGISFLLFGGWLIAKGFPEREGTAPAG